MAAAAAATEELDSPAAVAAAAAAAATVGPGVMFEQVRFPADPELEHTFRALRPKIKESLSTGTYRLDNVPLMIASIANLVERIGGIFYRGEDKRKLVFALYQLAVDELAGGGGVGVSRALLDLAMDQQFVDNILAVVIGVSKGQLFWQKKSFWARWPCCACCR